MTLPKLTILKGNFTVHRLPPFSSLPQQVVDSDFYTVSKTEDELSILCHSDIPFNSQESEPGWSCIKIIGPIEFSQVGILAKISEVLAEAKISIFAVSTYDTDYILIKTADLEVGMEKLIIANYLFD